MRMLHLAPVIALIASIASGTLAATRFAEASPVDSSVEGPLRWDLSERDAALPGQTPPDLRQADRWIDRVLVEHREARAQSIEQSAFDAVDACVTSEMSQVGAAGASIAIALDGEPVYSKGYGLKHADEGGEVDAETLFRIGSTTKMMTAAALMQQLEAGRLSLDDPVTRHVPEFQIAPPFSADDITLHQLMTHSTGFPDRIGEAFDGATLDQWASSQAQTQLIAPPGSFWNYSNPGWSLAGLVVQRVSGLPYRQYMKERIWGPAGMPLTTMDPAEVLAHGNYATGNEGARRIPPEAFDSLWGGPAGFAFSTPSEMIRWALLMMEEGGDVIAASSAAAMQDAQIDLQLFPGQGYGYGIFVDSYRGVQTLSHGGNIDGYSSQLYWVPERGFAVSILASSGSSLSNSAICAMREVMELAPTGPPPDLSTDPASWERYAGTYGLRETYGLEQTLWIRHTGDGLELVLGPEQALPLVQIAGDYFAMDQNGDGQPDGSRFSLLAHPDRPERAEWMRNRGAVGIRAGHFPVGMEIQGLGCVPMAFESHMRFDAPRYRAFGLKNLDLPMNDQSVSQDDPDDPASSGYRHVLTLPDSMGRLAVDLEGQSGDDLDLFLLYDLNADGNFDYPGEAIAASTSSGPVERVDLMLPGGLPGGSYAIWVHGYRVQGNDRSCNLRLSYVAGNDMSIPAGPQEVLPKTSHGMNVCVGGQSAEALEWPRNGLITIRTGSAPSTLYLPVRWRPAEPQPAAIFLPTLSASFDRDGP